VGSFGPVLVVAILTSLSMMPVSLITAAFLKSAFDVATVGCFPFFILLFFSGCMFPLPGVRLFSFAGYVFNVFDILPLTHASTAFGKILNSGAGISDVLYELCMILLLTAVYFIIGLFLYRRRKLSRA
jgi:ABC-2 type transport system permease protein